MKRNIDLQIEIDLAYARLKAAMMHKIQLIPARSSELSDLLRKRDCDE